MYSFFANGLSLMSKAGLSFCRPLEFTNSLIHISLFVVFGVVEEDVPKAIVLTISEALNPSRVSTPPRSSRADIHNLMDSMRRRFSAPFCSHNCNSNSDICPSSRLLAFHRFNLRVLDRRPKESRRMLLVKFLLGEPILCDLVHDVHVPAQIPDEP